MSAAPPLQPQEPSLVIPGLVPGIPWMAGSSPAMTSSESASTQPHTALVVGVPYIGDQGPLAIDLAPDDDVLAGDLLRRLCLGLEADGADFARAAAAEWQDVERRQRDVAHLLHRLTPELGD